MNLAHVVAPFFYFLSALFMGVSVTFQIMFWAFRKNRERIAAESCLVNMLCTIPIFISIACFVLGYWLSSPPLFT